MTTDITPREIEFAFTGLIMRDEATTGWTVVEVPGSADVFSTRKPVKVGGTIDGHAFRATLLPTGRGPHMMPINATLRKTIGKGKAGDVVSINLTQRFS